MRHHPGGSHTQHAIPDEKMSSRKRRDFALFSPTSRQRRIMQDVANSKRRQRDAR